MERVALRGRLTSGAGNRSSVRSLCAFCFTLLATLGNAAATDHTEINALRRGTTDGVISREQVARGRRQYLTNCSSACHGAGLTGSERVPSLAGEAFVQRWRGRSVDELFQRIKLTMPQTAPQSLSDTTYVDLVAFLLDSNGFPTGLEDLRPDSEALRAILIVDPDNG
jgi:mono/diheme cytochrome c family protein